MSSCSAWFTNASSWVSRPTSVARRVCSLSCTERQTPIVLKVRATMRPTTATAVGTSRHHGRPSPRASVPESSGCVDGRRARTRQAAPPGTGTLEGVAGLRMHHLLEPPQGPTRFGEGPHSHAHRVVVARFDQHRGPPRGTLPPRPGADLRVMRELCRLGGRRSGRPRRWETTSGREGRASPALARLAPDPVAAPAADRVAPTVRPEHFIRRGAAVDLVLARPHRSGRLRPVAFQPILSRSAAYQIAVWPAKGDVAASVPALHDVVAGARL